MKIYQLTVKFIEKTEAVLTLKAASEEDAIARVRSELHGQVNDLEITEVADVTDIAIDPEAPLPDNVINFTAATDKSNVN